MKTLLWTLVLVVGLVSGAWAQAVTIAVPPESAGAAGARGMRPWALVGHSASTTASASTVWTHPLAYGANYTWAPQTTTATLWLASDNATTAGRVIQVRGLDQNWAYKVLDVQVTDRITSGQLVAGEWRRVFGVESVGSALSTSTLYCFTGTALSTGTYRNTRLTTGSMTVSVPADLGTIQSMLPTTGEGRSQNAVWTVPAGSRAALYYVQVPANATLWRVLIRPYGQQWRTLLESKTVGRYDLDGMIVLDTKTDVRLDATAASGDVYAILGLVEFN
jgi:hypothetical protein